MTLADDLDRCDGRGADLESLSSAYPPTSKVISTLLSCTDSSMERRQANATWLLLKYGRGGWSFESTHVRSLLKALPRVTSWEAQLNLLQIIDHLKIPKGSVRSLHRYLCTAVEADNKFVRAWAYNAMHVLALQYPDYATEAEQLLVEAEEDPAASVRARIRQIKKKMRRAGER
jgi:hypothetical protein